MRIVLARPDEAVRYWPQVEKALSGTLALVKETHLPTDVLAAILTGQMVLFLAVEGDEIKGATVAHFTFYPRMKALTAFLVGGDELAAWRDAMTEAVEQFGRAHGCARIEGGGRRGWFRAIGYTEVGAMFRKEL